MCISDMLQHVVDGPFRGVTLAVVSPTAGAAAGRRRGPIGRPTTQGFVALRIGTCIKK